MNSIQTDKQKENIIYIYIYIAYYITTYVIQCNSTIYILIEQFIKTDFTSTDWLEYTVKTVVNIKLIMPRIVQT